MRIGVSLSSSITADGPVDAARFLIERAQAADRAGLDSLSLGDQHATSAPYQQNTPMLGRLMAEWGPRPVGCLFLLPLWHPVLVAEHVGTLAALTDAPFIVQTGIGYGERQFAVMNADHSTRGRVLEESIRVVKALLAGEEVESELVGGPVRLGLRPHQAVEWWIGGGPAPAAIERAGRLGDAWYGSPALTPDAAAAQLDRYLASCAAHGGTPRPIVRKDVLVLGDGDRARRAGRELIDAGYRGLGPDELIIGDPEAAAEQLAPFAEMGFTDVICRCMANDQAIALETLERLAEVRELVAPT